MDAATALSVAQTLFATLQCEEVRKLCSMLKYKSELKDLLDTVDTVKTLLLQVDSESRELNNVGQLWVDKLKNAVYDADDLFDEYKTIAEQHKNKKPGRNISKKVRLYFSSKKLAFKTSGEIKKLREKLDKIAKDHKDFGFSKLYKPVKIREETCSYVYEQNIIGRDNDKKKIVDLLLKDDLENNISFVTIVGIGGLGKTTLAKLVFSDHRIIEAFEENMRYWVCASENFGMKDILGKMIGNKDLEFEDLFKKVQNQIERKRYFLVLDDVWCEEGIKWDDLRDFLNLGGKGSRILVTSRSEAVATAIGNYPMHKLQGLSKKDSWELFRKISLGDKEDEAIAGFVEIGREIVKKCVNVPLSIRVVASLLRGQDINAWELYKRIDLAKMRDDQDESLMPTLMFSYYHLDPALKSCFSFCSVFPQDYEIDKAELIGLWSAHGYLVPSGTDNSMEDVGKRNISILLHRCFLQDAMKSLSSKLLWFFSQTRNSKIFGDIIESVTMHDLMHDLARKVAGKESSTHEIGKARHLFIDTRSKECVANLSSSSNYTCETLRSLFMTLKGFRYDIDEGDWCSIISKCRRLRVLSIRYSISFRLPELDRLLHLRYLDLSNNYHLQILPKSITKLHNLQTLKLARCRKLKELPEDTSKLVNLRVLDIKECLSLTHMPAGMGTLTCLHTLTTFIVCKVDDDPKQDKKIRLIDLKPLINNLRGHLCFRGSNSDESYNELFDKYMMVQLDSLKVMHKCDCFREGQKKLLELLFANSQSGQLLIQNYKGTKLPSLASGLVSISLKRCNKLQYLPSSLSQLLHLKYLFLDSMKIMEYIESDAPSPPAKFFPCLEELYLIDMPKLKGWWMQKETVLIPSFPRLCKLDIKRCERLTYIPQFPHVKKLYLKKVNEALTFCKKGGAVESNPLYLNELRIDNSSVFNSLIREFVRSAVSIELEHIENLGTIEHLTNLNSLKIKDCHELKSLPKEIRHLTSLTTLEVRYWPELKSLPEAIKYLTSLNKLTIIKPSPELKDRCQEPDGEDWLKICHIPDIYISDFRRS